MVQTGLSKRRSCCLYRNSILLCAEYQGMPKISAKCACLPVLEKFFLSLTSSQMWEKTSVINAQHCSLNYFREEWWIPCPNEVTGGNSAACNDLDWYLAATLGLMTRSPVESGRGARCSRSARSCPAKTAPAQCPSAPSCDTAYSRHRFWLDGKSKEV